ncbi:MAG: corrinoid protein [Acidobacteriota bacterium]
MALNQQLFDSICGGDRTSVEEIVKTSLADDITPVDLLNHSMIPAMREMGNRFSRNDAYVPDMLIAARAMQTGLNIIEPLLVQSGYEPAGTVCIGTVKGDLHDIGKNLVAIMLKGAGFEVMDLGVNCDVAKFDEAVRKGAQAVLCSALLTTTMPYMKTVVDFFRENPGVKVLIGGAPVTKNYANEIGADGFGKDANEAVAAVEKVLG